jgi:diadenosine hexaphosphate hydrolase (ATP-forming)
MKRAYGGVLINEMGRVLLRKPRGLHKTRVWTFAKGKQKDGENAQQTALREVLEETGVRAKVIRQVLVPSENGGVHDEYFLMAPLEDTGRFDEETVAIVWATKGEAEELISMTEDPERRIRDLKILQFAFEIFGSVRGLIPFSSPADDDLL